MTNDILSELNESQRLAVSCTEGPELVIAGAGSGKTRVLTYRVAHLLNIGADPFNILALTFTNKAAREMKERIIKLVGNSDARNVWMGTFHSIFARILRSEGERMGYPSNFSIYDSEDSKGLIKSILKEQNLDPKVYIPAVVHNRISSSKNSLVSAEDYNNNIEITEQDTAAGRPMLGRLFRMYQERLKKASAMDFDDLLFNTNVLLRDFPDILHKYQQKFKYILVDEYQDTNYAQYLIIKKLSANNENICVVGDDAQSIYGFRGANIQNILNFKSDYPDAQIFKLEQNYRSTKTILSAANSIINKNKNQIHKELWTENDEGNLIKVLKASTDNEEGSMVANSIFETKMTNLLPNDAFAVLYRTNAQSRAVEESLRKLNIPYRIYGGLSFYRRREIKDVLAYFRLVINNKDEEALFRIINYPHRGIGKTTLERLVVVAGEQQKSPWEILENLQFYNLGINSGIQQKIIDFVMMIRSFSAQLSRLNAFDLAKLIANSSGIIKDLKNAETPEDENRIENIEELLNAIKDFTEKESSEALIPIGEDIASAEPLLPEEAAIAAGQNSVRTLDLFMRDVALLTDSDNDDPDDRNRVSLMTIHTAKGLEFPYVYIVGLEENLFPIMQALGNRDELEEERRLFYVAMTRAMTGLTISYAQNRYRWGDLIFCEPSRFLDEIDPAFVDMPRKKQLPTDGMIIGNPALNKDPLAKKFVLGKPDKKFKPLKQATLAETTTSTEPVNTDEIQVGMTVEHQRFGVGKVISVEGNGPNKKSTVFFQGVGQKQLLLQFAKLKIVT